MSGGGKRYRGAGLSSFLRKWGLRRKSPLSVLDLEFFRHIVKTEHRNWGLGKISDLGDFVFFSDLEKFSDFEKIFNLQNIYFSENKCGL